MEPIRVGILGATGAVGQRFIQLLAGHPWFTITALAASERSAGQAYGDACTWRVSADCPEAVRRMPVQPLEPNLDCQIVFSALPADVATDIEVAFAAAGYGVFSNASSHRMDADVPLLIPEVNAHHLEMLPAQQRRRGWDRGYIVTNPNCSTIGLTLALKPLHDAFTVRRVVVTTMQSVSGAGYPGVPSMDMIDNVVPYIGSEEDKLVREPLKLLGELAASGDHVVPAHMRISPSCNRVATRDGHLETVSVEFADRVTPADAVAAFRGFRSLPYELGCPSAVDPTIVVRNEPDRPQTVRDRDTGHGMAATVGRVRACEVFDVKFVVLSHNTIRGAAGCSILNAELMAARGMLS